MFRGSVTDTNKKYNMRGPIVKPGKYSATLYLVESGSTTKLSEKKSFELKPIYKSTLKGTSFEDYEDENFKRTLIRVWIKNDYM